MKTMKTQLALGATCLFMGGFGFAADKGEVVVKSTAALNGITPMVADYKSFLEYGVKSEQLAVKAGKRASMQADETFKLKDENIELSGGKPFTESNDYKKEAYLGAEKQIAIYDKKTHKVRILDVGGRLIREVKISKFHHDSGMLAFSDTRIFVIGDVLESNGGFKVFDNNGNLIKEVNPGFVDGYSVSRTAKYFAVTAGGPKIPYSFILYDMDGKELWKQKIISGGHARIDFSRDDKFASIKLPDYWITDETSVPHKTISKEKRVYVIDIVNRNIIAEEDYEK